MLENRPLQGNFSENNVSLIVTNDMNKIIYNSCKVDLSKLDVTLNPDQITSVVNIIKNIYEKIYTMNINPLPAKQMILYSILGYLCNIWVHSNNPVNFFIEMKKSFLPAHLVAGFAVYFSNNKTEWLIRFFNENKKLIESGKKNIKTIGLYWRKYYSGGVEKFLSLIMPIYLEMNYNVVLFTDEIDEEKEYPLPTPPPPWQTIYI